MIGKPPTYCGYFPFQLPEVMYYLYLPVAMREPHPVDGKFQPGVRLPPNLELFRPLVEAAMRHAARSYRYVYISARKGWATPDNPLNRPGWHCDGYGTDDLNYVWWRGAGTRFAVQEFENISEDHNVSMLQFEAQVRPESIATYAEGALFCIDPEVVHATPVIPAPGQWRQYVKVSLSDHQYNLENNSHNYLFDYAWKMQSREQTRNSPHAAQKDYA